MSVLARLVRNWQLKVGAVGLATILYTGFVYSGSFTEQQFPGVPVQTINQPDGSVPLDQRVTTVDIRYRIAADADRVDAESFAVTVDLSAYDMERAGEPQSLAIEVEPLADGLDVLDYDPTVVTVTLDRLASKQVRVVVDRGEVPDGLSISRPQVSDSRVTASGPASQLGRVDHAVAHVGIDESGIDINDQFDLVPVDVDGRRVESVDLDPSSVTVEIDVQTIQTTKTVPIRLDVRGSPASGFEVGTVNVEPSVVTLRGLPGELSGVTDITSEPISVAGATNSLTVDLELIIPDGLALADPEESAPVATIGVRPATIGRTLLLAVACEGEEDGLACLPQIEQVAVTLRGSGPALEALSANQLLAVLDVSGLAPGRHNVTPTIELPDEIELAATSPASVPVVIQAPATPSPSPG